MNIKSNPLVSINILSFNRKNELRNTIDKIIHQSYNNVEIIVVDNNSTDGTSEMIESFYPEITLIKLKSNIGISGWNYGFEIAKGEYILVLDDDSYPDKNTIREGINYFNRVNKLGIVAFNVFNTRLNVSETKDFKENPRFFVGCGALISKEVLNRIGLYNTLYFIYYHELDYSARCYNEGFQIIYLPHIFVFHNQSLLSRGEKTDDPFKSEYRYKYYFESYAIFLIQNFIAFFSVLFLLKWIINRSFICIRKSYYLGYFQALFHLIRKLPRILKSRRILKKDIQKFYDYGNIPFIDRTYF